METLHARMDRDQYGALAQTLHETIQLLIHGRQGIIGSEDDAPFTPELNREFATVPAILLPGKMDQRIVPSGPRQRNTVQSRHAAQYRCASRAPADDVPHGAPVFQTPDR
ncbi:hypothetical protein ABZV34_32155 [Streptomyces sp. NPDC005195]|uniref:hypothetical protein n=1 Tax=Streptomyces sp. NPDC005195 TaxID=3154561 RepID=UPI0033ACCD61